MRKIKYTQVLSSVLKDLVLVTVREKWRFGNQIQNKGYER